MNITYVNQQIKKEIKDAIKRKASQVSSKEQQYFSHYILTLQRYLAKDLTPSKVANISNSITNIYDDSKESADIDACKFIMRLIEK